MRGKSAFEVLDQSQDVGQASVLRDLFEEIPRQLSKLNVLELQLPVRVAPGDADSDDRREEDSLLGGRPAKQLAMKIVERDPVRGLVPPLEGAAEDVEAASQAASSRGDDVERIVLRFRLPLRPSDAREPRLDARVPLFRRPEVH